MRPYVRCMSEVVGSTDDPVKNHAVVVAVTRDHADVWLIEPHQTQPLVVVRRDDEQSEHRHVRTGEYQHGHGSDEGFADYFGRLASALSNASEVMIAGHGKGRANAMEEFAEYLQKRETNLFSRVTELRYVDLSHVNGRQLAALAREWKREQFVRGAGNL